MLDHHADALPDHTLLHHLDQIPLGHDHSVDVHAAEHYAGILDHALDVVPRLGGAAQGLHGVLDVAMHVVDTHDHLVDVTHGQWADPFA